MVTEGVVVLLGTVGGGLRTLFDRSTPPLAYNPLVTRVLELFPVREEIVPWEIITALMVLTLGLMVTLSSKIKTSPYLVVSEEMILFSMLMIPVPLALAGIKTVAIPKAARVVL